MPETIDVIEIEEIEKRINRAIAVFGENEQDLLHPLGGERNISQRFAYWLQNEFAGWNVDCEYQNIVDGTSGTTRRKVASLLMRRVKDGFIHLNEPHETLVIPDIIIHRRKHRENLLAIEVKNRNDHKEIEFDFEKLQAYCASEDLLYRFACFIRFQEPNDAGNFVAEIRYFTA